MTVAAPATARLRGGTLLRAVVTLFGVAAALLCWSGRVGSGLSAPAHNSLGVTCLAVGLWAGELVPLPVTGLLATVLLFITQSVPSVEQALSGFQAPVLYFLLGSSAIGVAAEETGLADRLAAALLSHSRGSGRRLLTDLIASMPLQALVLPSAMSRNTVLVPVYERVLVRLGRPRRLGAAIMLALGVLGPLASSAILSGGVSPVAAASALGGFTWLSWFVRLAPLYYLLLAIDALALWFFIRPEPVVGDSASTISRRADRFSAGEWRLAVIGSVTALLWIGDRATHWPTAVPALLALVALLTPGIGVMNWQTFSARAPWGICVVLASATSLADALSHTGAAAWAAHALFRSLSVPHTAGPMAVAVFLVTALITLAIPNRAAAITLGIPLATAFAASGTLNPTAAGLMVLFAVDAETIYPAQTATNLLAYETGYFGLMELAAFNLLTILLAAAVGVLVALPWWTITGLPTTR